MFVPLISTACALTPLLGGLYGVPIWQRCVETRRLREALVASQTLVLNFDDGPGPQLTPALLDLLASYDAPATFFPMGRRAEASPLIMDRLAHSRHEVGTHSYAHLHAWRSWPWQSRDDADRGYRAMAKWITPDALFRPPYGKMNWLTSREVKRRAARVGWWTVDTRDTRPVLPRIETIVESVARAGGASVLMHDFDRGPQREAFVLSVTEALLVFARDHGWHVSTLGAVMADDTAEVAA